MINFLAADCPQHLLPIVRFVKYGIFPIIQIGIPIILVVLGTLDLGKAVIAGKEDEMKNAQKILIKRCIYAVMVFFVVTIVSLVFSLFSNTGEEEDKNIASDWLSCWEIKPSNDKEDKADEENKDNPGTVG